MRALAERGYRDHGRGGFTLLELLVVVSILAVVAFIATGTFRGVSEDANDRLVHSEMQAIVKAVRQFKADTGYYPKTGPFAREDEGGEVTNGILNSNYGVSAADAERWFYSPANFYQLLSPVSPLVGTGHALEEWDADSGRGWRGPYLQGYQDGYVNLHDGINDGTPTADGYQAGDPLSGNAISNIPGIADPFEAKPQSSAMQWRLTADGAPRDKWGRPYLLLKVDGRLSVVSMGPDGFYDQAEQSEGPDDDIYDIVLPVE
ncbi:MAG: type II secretion system protein [Puniceicoccales bacterium]